MYRRSLIPFVAVLPFGSIAFAQNWINPAGGSWGDTANWSPATLPGNATFDLDSPGYTVTLPASYTPTPSGPNPIPSITVQNDNPTIALNGFTPATPSLNVATTAGQSGSLTLLGPGEFLSGNVDLSAGMVNVGTTGATGYLTVDDATLIRGGDLTDNGFTVNGLTVENGGVINLQPTDPYSVTNGIFNNGTLQTMGNPLSLNEVNLSNGSGISGFDVTLGNATLDDSSIGTTYGSLTIQGKVTASNNSILAGATGTTVSGTLNLLSGARLNSGETMAGGMISVELNSQVSDPVFRPISSDNGTLEFTLQNGFEPFVGEQFDVLNVSDVRITGTFAALILPALPAGESWDTNNLYTTGVISVVPEPMSLGIVSMGLAGLALRRRRRC